MMKKIVLAGILLCANAMAIEVGKVPPAVSISGDNGGKTDGTPWDSRMLKDKVIIAFYVDPDKKDLNSDLNHALQKKRFDGRKFGSVAIVNMAATWMPDVAIEALLKKKQKEFKNTLYVRDRNKLLVKKWGLADDNSDVLLFDKKGKLIYKKFGKLSKSEINALIKLIEKNL